MSVLIKGIKIPMSCYDCFLCDDECFGSYKCSQVKEWGSAESRAPDCPIVEIPPHGRCIDADALAISTAVPLNGKPYRYVHIDNIKGAPTIIPASEEGE